MAYESRNRKITELNEFLFQINKIINLLENFGGRNGAEDLNDD